MGVVLKIILIFLVIFCKTRFWEPILRQLFYCFASLWRIPPPTHHPPAKSRAAPSKVWPLSCGTSAGWGIVSQPSALIFVITFYLLLGCTRSFEWPTKGLLQWLSEIHVLSMMWKFRSTCLGSITLGLDSVRGAEPVHAPFMPAPSPAACPFSPKPSPMWHWCSCLL